MYIKRLEPRAKNILHTWWIFIDARFDRGKEFFSLNKKTCSNFGDRKVREAHGSVQQRRRQSF